MGIPPLLKYAPVGTYMTIEKIVLGGSPIVVLALPDSAVE